MNAHAVHCLIPSERDQGKTLKAFPKQEKDSEDYLMRPDRTADSSGAAGDSSRNGSRRQSRRRDDIWGAGTRFETPRMRVPFTSAARSLFVWAQYAYGDLLEVRRVKFPVIFVSVHPHIFIPRSRHQIGCILWEFCILIKDCTSPHPKHTACN